jgi:hypothetical protein
MRRLQLCLASISLVLLAACDDPNPTEIWELDATPWVCDNGVDYHFCGTYIVVDTGQGNGLYQGIDGLETQWGYSYTVEVEIIEVEDPGADGYSIRYELVELIDQEAHPGEEFLLSLQRGWVEVEQEGGMVAGNAFTCTLEQCTELGLLIDDDRDIRGKFRFGPIEQLLPLELVSFEAAAEYE